MKYWPSLAATCLVLMGYSWFYDIPLKITNPELLSIIIVILYVGVHICAAIENTKSK